MLEIDLSDIAELIWTNGSSLASANKNGLRLREAAQQSTSDLIDAIREFEFPQGGEGEGDDE